MPGTRGACSPRWPAKHSLHVRTQEDDFHGCANGWHVTFADSYPNGRGRYGYRNVGQTRRHPASGVARTGIVVGETGMPPRPGLVRVERGQRRGSADAAHVGSHGPGRRRHDLGHRSVARVERSRGGSRLSSAFPSGRTCHRRTETRPCSASTPIPRIVMASSPCGRGSRSRSGQHRSRAGSVSRCTRVTQQAAPWCCANPERASRSPRFPSRPASASGTCSP